MILAFIFLIALNPKISEARFGRGRFYSPGFYGPSWKTGYWFHGTYVGRVGWWWVVGPTWYFYPAPVYPYPPANAQPVYILQAAGLPPPPPAPIPDPSSKPTMSGESSKVVAPPSEKGRMQAPVKSQAFSYYCEASKGYYPNIKDCPNGWTTISVQPPN